MCLDLTKFVAISFLFESTGGTKANENNHWRPPCESRKMKQNFCISLEVLVRFGWNFQQSEIFEKYRRLKSNTEVLKRFQVVQRGNFSIFNVSGLSQIFTNFFLFQSTGGTKANEKNHWYPPCKNFAYLLKYLSDLVEIFNRAKFLKNIDDSRVTRKS